MKTAQQHEAYSLDDPVEMDEGLLRREIASGEASIVEKLEREETRGKCRTV